MIFNDGGGGPLWVSKIIRLFRGAAATDIRHIRRSSDS